MVNRVFRKSLAGGLDTLFAFCPTADQFLIITVLRQYLAYLSQALGYLSQVLGQVFGETL